MDVAGNVPLRDKYTVRFQGLPRRSSTTSSMSSALPRNLSQMSGLSRFTTGSMRTVTSEGMLGMDDAPREVVPKLKLPSVAQTATDPTPLASPPSSQPQQQRAGAASDTPAVSMVSTLSSSYSTVTTERDSDAARASTAPNTSISSKFLALAKVGTATSAGAGAGAGAGAAAGGAAGAAGAAGAGAAGAAAGAGAGVGAQADLPAASDAGEPQPPGKESRLNVFTLARHAKNWLASAHTYRNMVKKRSMLKADNQPLPVVAAVLLQKAWRHRWLLHLESQANKEQATQSIMKLHTMHILQMAVRGCLSVSVFVCAHGSLCRCLPDSLFLCSLPLCPSVSLSLSSHLCLATYSYCPPSCLHAEFTTTSPFAPPVAQPWVQRLRLLVLKKAPTRQGCRKESVPRQVHECMLWMRSVKKKALASHSTVSSRLKQLYGEQVRMHTLPSSRHFCAAHNRTPASVSLQKDMLNMLKLLKRQLNAEPRTDDSVVKVSRDLEQQPMASNWLKIDSSMGDSVSDCDDDDDMIDEHIAD